MKDLNQKQFKSVCEYYNQAKEELSIENYKYNVVDFYWGDFNLRVVTNGHNKGREIDSISSLSFIDGDSYAYKCPNLILAPIIDLVIDQYGAINKGFEPTTWGEHYGTGRI